MSEALMKKKPLSRGFQDFGLRISKQDERRLFSKSSV